MEERAFGHVGEEVAGDSDVDQVRSDRQHLSDRSRIGVGHPCHRWRAWPDAASVPAYGGRQSARDTAEPCCSMESASMSVPAVATTGSVSRSWLRSLMLVSLRLRVWLLPSRPPRSRAIPRRQPRGEPWPGRRGSADRPSSRTAKQRRRHRRLAACRDGGRKF